MTSGSYGNVFDLTAASSFNAAFITANGGNVAGAEAALASGLESGQTYLTVHTSAYPGGEIRGFLTSVPEPGAVGLLASGLAFLVLLRRKRRT